VRESGKELTVEGAREGEEFWLIKGD